MFSYPFGVVLLRENLEQQRYKMRTLITSTIHIILIFSVFRWCSRAAFKTLRFAAGSIAFHSQRCSFVCFEATSIDEYHLDPLS